MTAVISGTNGLLQAYDYQTPTTGFSYTFAAGTQTLVMNPAGTLATGTITMPASPSDGMTITFSSSQQITALTMSGNGKSIVGAVTFLPASTGVTYVYRSTGTTWYPTATVPGTGSQIVSGTSQASTSGTSITFSSIPSWVRRITVMFNGVSTTGTSVLIVQVGAGSVLTSGYLGVGYGAASGASMGTIQNGVGFSISNVSAATYVRNGMAQLCAIGGNSWAFTASVGLSDTSVMQGGAGAVALSGTLDRVVITTAGGTDTFDNGNINILYE
jgi:hypothetical protein